MHLKKVTVFFPLFFCVYFCIRIKWIRKVSLRRFFQPVDVFNAVVRVLLVMDMIKPVPVFLVFYHVRACRKNARKGKKHCGGEKFYCFIKRLLHIIFIGKKTLKLTGNLCFKVKARAFFLLFWATRRKTAVGLFRVSLRTCVRNGFAALSIPVAFIPYKVAYLINRFCGVYFYYFHSFAFSSPVFVYYRVV